jgi:uronate dehydrogenase
MLKRLLLTGAAGGIGQEIRPFLTQLAETVLLSDLVPVANFQAHETFQSCDLADKSAVDRLVDGVDGILHLGGVSVEKPFDMVLNGNIIGAYNLFEAARHHGRPRMIFASSNHVVGYYRRDEKLDASVMPRPDSLYGVSKVFGESLASLYFDKFGPECLSIRIGSCFPQPKNPRMLSTWLAIEDLVALCACAFAVPRLGNCMVYGVSDNETVW